MTSTTTKKIIAAFALVAIGAMGVAGPAEARPAQPQGGHVWCC